jgi:Right handed beta helix region
MTRTILMAAALVLAVTLPAVPASAQANRTFVSAAGSDSNNCTSVTTPCRHFANAYAVTAPNGEIDVLDPANYGALTVTGPVSIEGHGWASISAVSGSAAITINANAGDKINIIGVVLDGIAITGTTGIQFNSGGTLTVRDSVIRNFGADGIDLSASASTSSQIFVSNTSVSDNGGQGIFINPGLNFQSGTATTGVLDHVQMENNGGNGLKAQSFAQPVNMAVSDSVIANNGSNGVFINSTGVGTLQIMVRNSTITNNNTALNATGIGFAFIFVTRSTIFNNGSAYSGNVVESYADNNIDANGTNNSTPGTALPYH